MTEVWVKWWGGQKGKWMKGVRFGWIGRMGKEDR